MASTICCAWWRCAIIKDLLQCLGDRHAGQKGGSQATRIAMRAVGLRLQISLGGVIMMQLSRRPPQPIETAGAEMVLPAPWLS